MDVHPFVHAIIGFALKLSPATVSAQAQAAVDAAKAHHTNLGLSEPDAAGLLLGLAYAESRYDMDALSRIECRPKQPCKRVTSVWRKKTKPQYAKPSWFCGPVQTGGHVSWATCQRMREDAAYAYETAARELAVWLKDPSCRRMHGQQKLVCGIRGYAGGYAAIKNGTLRYPFEVFRLAKIIDQRVRRYELKNIPRT